MSERLVAIAALTVLAACSGEATERNEAHSAPQLVAQSSAVAPRTSATEKPELLNGCALEDAEDARDRTDIAIRFGGLLGHNFEPRCIRVRQGARLRFEGPLEVHPIAPGRIVEGIPVDEAGPVGTIGEGELVEFVADEVGEFGFYCDLHVSEGMMGALYVEPTGDIR